MEEPFLFIWVESLLATNERVLEESVPYLLLDLYDNKLTIQTINTDAISDEMCTPKSRALAGRHGQKDCTVAARAAASVATSVAETGVGMGTKARDGEAGTAGAGDRARGEARGEARASRFRLRYLLRTRARGRGGLLP